MIIIIEGSQGSGKTHLVRSLKKNYVEREGLENIIFYKYQHVAHLRNLDIEHIEPDPGFHYFTISNTLTILELHQAILSDKVFVFDRGVISAYVWSIMRKRLSDGALNREFRNLLNNKLFSNCHIIRIKANLQMDRDHSDIFDNYTDTNVENNLFDILIRHNIDLLQNQEKNNTYHEVINHMDKLSEAALYQTFVKILSENNNK